MIVKKIYEFPRTNRGLWGVLADFMAFYDPTVRWKGQDYRFEMGVVRAEPVVCGADLRAVTDLVVDHGSHYWQPYYRNWSESAPNSGVQVLDHGQTFRRLDKHNCYDLLARAMHPRDRHPTTVLLPEFFPYTPEQEAQLFWEQEQLAIAECTTRGFDPNERRTDWDQVRANVATARREYAQLRALRDKHYCSHDYLKETVETRFGGRFPLYLKTAFGRGGEDVTKVHSLEELYRAYDRTWGGAYHLQEAIERYDVFVRCMAVGPQVLFMDYRPHEPMHLHYGEAPLALRPDTAARLRNYVRFVNAYHRWSHNTFEAVIANDVIHPIDYANASPDCTFTSLHVYYFWVLCALVRWTTFVVVADVDLRADLEQQRYRAILQDPARSQEQKYAACAAVSREYFCVDEFEEYCARGLPGLEDAMKRYYDAHIEQLIERQIRASDFPPHEHDHFIGEYRRKVDTHFRPVADEFLRVGSLRAV